MNKERRYSHCLVAANKIQSLNLWLALLRLDASRPMVKDDGESVLWNQLVHMLCCLSLSLKYTM